MPIKGTAVISQKVALFILAISVAVSSWIYWKSDVKIEQVLVSKEWQSSTSAYLSPKSSQTVVNDRRLLRKISAKSSVKYLPNGTYLRESIIEIFGDDNDISSELSVSEMGQWEISADYLLISPTEFKDMATNKSIGAEVDLIKQLFIMDAQQSRRIDIINNKAILLTSLNHGSRILWSN
ncbi:transmembrane regulatory protein ToxS [Vibrio sp. MACH09]|nr:regulatory protein ToxS [Vibrio sp. 99-8-1]NOI67722.1 hypothetical protein [Vibrio sp. 99-8-1]GLO60243.1 transmembrane regulatory protein ToxS [Vibrio sp. MACH09]